MSEERARDFYAMTNSVSHDEARWLNSREMRRWIEGKGEVSGRDRREGE